MILNDLFGAFCRHTHVALAGSGHGPLRCIRPSGHPAARAGARESCADFQAGVWDFNPKPE
jgi:hypothetical protein